MITLNHKRALRTIHDKLGDVPVDWAITGSLARALHGLDVDLGDIDLQTDGDGVYRIEKAFGDSIVRNVTLNIGIVLAQPHQDTRADAELAKIRREVRKEFYSWSGSSEAERQAQIAKSAAREKQLRQRCLKLAQHNPGTKAELFALVNRDADIESAREP